MKKRWLIEPRAALKGMCARQGVKFSSMRVDAPTQATALRLARERLAERGLIGASDLSEFAHFIVSPVFLQKERVTE